MVIYPGNISGLKFLSFCALLCELACVCVRVRVYAWVSAIVCVYIILRAMLV
jgi:hypothetical protein